MTARAAQVWSAVVRGHGAPEQQPLEMPSAAQAVHPSLPLPTLSG